MEVPEYLQERVAEILGHKLCTQIELREAAEKANTPFVIYGGRVFKDGNKYCALNGLDLQQGFGAFGDTPAEAVERFNEHWAKK